MTKNEQLPLTEKEHELVRRIAEKNGITEDEAASQLISKEIARRVKKRTGRGPGKVFTYRRG